MLFVLLAFVSVYAKESSLAPLEDNAEVCSYRYTLIYSNGTHSAHINSTSGSSNYAGRGNVSILGLAVKVSVGTVAYRVHVKGGSWLPYVTGFDWSDYDNGYAGNGKPIDAISIKADQCTPEYRTSIPNTLGWLDWQTAETGKGYAGQLGSNIDLVQIRPKTAIPPPPTCNPQKNMIQMDSQYAGVRRSGCLFCCACYIAGLCNISQVDQVYPYAVSKGWIGSDCYCNYDADTLYPWIASYLHTTPRVRSAVKYAHNSHHWWLVSSTTGKEVYNSAGAGWYDY